MPLRSALVGFGVRKETDVELLGKLLKTDYTVRFVWKATPVDIVECMTEFDKAGK